MKIVFASLLALLVPAFPMEVRAHPHIFIDAGLRIEVSDTGQITGIEVLWKYDELYSLLIFEDMELDPDYDGVLTDAELAKLDGFDLNWVADYKGDLYVSHMDQVFEPGPPHARGTKVENGQIITSHWRAVELPASGAVIEVYDPTFYTAYELSAGVDVVGACAAEITPADLDAAYARLEEKLFGMSQEEADMAFPEVGAEFADKVVIRCTD